MSKLLRQFFLIFLLSAAQNYAVERQAQMYVTLTTELSHCLLFHYRKHLHTFYFDLLFLCVGLLNSLLLSEFGLPLLLIVVSLFAVPRFVS